jgi:hypothetical protein
MRATRSTTSKPCAGSARTCRTSRFRAACRICHSRSAATTRCARRCTPRFSITPSAPG